MLPTSQAASQHASIAASLPLDQDESRVGHSLVVLDLGFIAVGIDKPAELVLEGFADRKSLDPRWLGRPFSHLPSMTATGPSASAAGRSSGRRHRTGSTTERARGLRVRRALEAQGFVVTTCVVGRRYRLVRAGLLPSEKQDRLGMAAVVIADRGSAGNGSRQ